MLNTGMVFNVTVGFNQLENSQASDDKSRVYAVIIGDTVVVNKVHKITFISCIVFLYHEPR